MSCSHSTVDPGPCSQCLGVRARKVVLDTKTGQVRVDGKVVPRGQESTAPSRKPMGKRAQRW